MRKKNKRTSIDQDHFGVEFNFISDDSLTGSGFKLIVKCIDPVIFSNISMNLGENWPYLYNDEIIQIDMEYESEHYATLIDPIYIRHNFYLSQDSILDSNDQKVIIKNHTNAIIAGAPYQSMFRYLLHIENVHQEINYVISEFSYQEETLQDTLLNKTKSALKITTKSNPNLKILSPLNDLMDTTCHSTYYDHGYERPYLPYLSTKATILPENGEQLILTLLDFNITSRDTLFIYNAIDSSLVSVIDSVNFVSEIKSPNADTPLLLEFKSRGSSLGFKINVSCEDTPSHLNPALKYFRNKNSSYDLNGRPRNMNLFGNKKKVFFPTPLFSN